MNQNQTISVVVPVYRAEGVLTRCVRSLQHQSWEALEILLVEDGSPDGSGLLCDQLAREDPRIRVIHQENAGVSAARNAGIRAARGRYLCFLDSDDWMLPRGVEVLHQALQSGGGSYAAGGCLWAHTGKAKHLLPRAERIAPAADPGALLDYLTRPGSYSVYAKLFDLTLIREKGLEFDPELSCGEDALFLRQYLALCPVLCLTPEPVCCYDPGNPESLSKQGHAGYSRSVRKKLEALEVLLRGLPLTEQQREAYLAGRAWTGLRNSLLHYYNSRNLAESRRTLAEQAARELMPWLLAQTPDFRGHRALARWAARWGRPLAKGDVDGFLRRATLWAAGRAIALRLGQWGKGLLRKSLRT